MAHSAPTARVNQSLRRDALQTVVTGPLSSPQILFAEYPLPPIVIDGASSEADDAKAV
jgi:hypothetical protein